GYVILVILVIIISKLIAIIINIKSIDFNKKNIYLVSSMVISVIFIFIIVSNVVLKPNKDSNEASNIYSVLIVIISATIMFMIYMAIRSDIKSKELDIKNVELINLQSYIEVTENQYNEIRKFKHDYINIISTIAGYIENEDICSLKNHFENNILPLTKSFENESVKLNILEKVKVMELKGLLKIKLAQAISKNIKVAVEVIEKIDKINFDVVNLCRVVGILLDNSIEAAETIEDGFVNIAIFKKENEVYIVIQNSFNGENISIQQIYKRGFSTKGKNRGLGLSTVKELLSNNKDVSSETIIDENIFTQLLKINNE
ncbi:MAG: sensor histidine kinase, partial [Clostridium sp.]